jgi:hypothetical protein
MKDVKSFLTLNGFIENEPNFFINDFCSVEMQKDGYAVADNEGSVMYSDGLNIYWLIGMLTYYGYMPQNYKKAQS